MVKDAKTKLASRHSSSKMPSDEAAASLILAPRHPFPYLRHFLSLPGLPQWQHCPLPGCCWLLWFRSRWGGGGGGRGGGLGRGAGGARGEGAQPLYSRSGSMLCSAIVGAAKGLQLKMREALTIDLTWLLLSINQKMSLNMTLLNQTRENKPSNCEGVGLGPH